MAGPTLCPPKALAEQRADELQAKSEQCWQRRSVDVARLEQDRLSARSGSGNLGGQGARATRMAQVAWGIETDMFMTAQHTGSIAQHILMQHRTAWYSTSTT